MNEFNITGRVGNIIKKSFNGSDGKEVSYYEILINCIREGKYPKEDCLHVFDYKELDAKITEGTEIKVKGYISGSFSEKYNRAFLRLIAQEIKINE